MSYEKKKAVNTSNKTDNYEHCEISSYVRTELNPTDHSLESLTSPSLLLIRPGWAALSQILHLTEDLRSVKLVE